MVSIASFLPDDLQSYVRQHGARECADLAAIRQETADLPEGEWQIPPEQGQFLSFLIGLTEAKSVLEIGTFTGYGTFCMAQSMPSGGQIVTLECTPRYSDIGRKYWKSAGLDNRINLRLGMALETLRLLLEEGMAGTFDFVFIDADKKEYGEYYEFALQLVRTGGLIAIDNMLWRGAVADSANQKNSTKSIRKLVEKIGSDSRVSFSLIPIGDGLMLAQRQI